MPSSDDRIKANQENSQHSTGPRTEEGKRVSSLNALRHGFNSPVDVLPGEDMKAYLGLQRELVQTWQPTGYYETHLIKRVTSYDWRLGRCGTLENGIFTVGHSDHGNEVDCDHPEIHAALTSARSFLATPNALETLGKHEYRLHRMRANTIKELEHVQAQRKQREADELARAAVLYKTAKMKGLQYNPPDDGFVLNNAEIELHLSRQDRREEAEIAQKCGFDIKKFRDVVAA